MRGTGKFEVGKRHHAMVGHECGRYRPFPALCGPEVCLPPLCGEGAGFTSLGPEPGAPRAAGTSPTSASCRRLAAAIQRPATWRARPGTAERRSFPLTAAHPTAATAATTEIFFESSAAATGTHPAPDRARGKMGRTDAGAEAARTAGSPPDADASSRPAAHGEKRDPRSASHASRAARAGHRFGSFQKQLLASGTGNPARRYPVTAGACGRWRGTVAAGVTASSSRLSIYKGIFSGPVDDAFLSAGRAGRRRRVPQVSCFDLITSAACFWLRIGRWRGVPRAYA